jgi:formylglycine-generating enzyme required for sulfatase activity
VGQNAQGYPEYRHRSTGIIFVELPGGEFGMGNSKKDIAKLIEVVINAGHERESKAGLVAFETPWHKVTLSPFLIAKYELSQAEWKRLMGNNPSRFRGETLPVEQITWDECREFCRLTGLSMPTDAQWEYAYKGGKEGHLRTGNLDHMGWYARNSNSRTHPVGEKDPNNFGVHDMFGNVWEFCEDVYSLEFYKTPEASQRDPVCSSGSDYRVIRGSGWKNYIHPQRYWTFRQGCSPKAIDYSTGLRPAYYPLP